MDIFYPSGKSVFQKEGVFQQPRLITTIGSGILSKMLTTNAVSSLVRKELDHITDPEILNRIRELLVAPHSVERDWDYGHVGERFICWTVLEHPPSNTGIAYCEQGFGPSNPWGLVFLSGEYMSIGMDCGWFSTLESAMRDSKAWHGTNPENYEVP